MMNSARIVPLLIVLATGSGACREPARPSGEAAPSRVILIVIDTLRADRLPFYGGPEHTAPFLASLAERSLVFDHAWASTSWTAPATASIFTGLHPNQHGIEFNVFSLRKRRKALGVDLDRRLPDDVETIPQLMQRLGYRTFGISDNPNVDRYLGFDVGFDRFAGRPALGKGGAAKVAEKAAEWRDEMKAADHFFLYLHLADPHTPYHRHADWLVEDGPRPRDHALDLAAYDSEIRFADEHLRQIVESLEVDERTLIIVTADHGQEFRDHGGRGHGFKLYAELTRVPLLLHRPGDPRLAGRDGRPVAHVDLLPTLRFILGEPEAAFSAGRSLLGPGTDFSADRPVYSMRTGILGQALVELRSVVKGRYKLIALDPLGQYELYDVVADPAEQVDLSAQYPERVAELSRLLVEQDARSEPPLDAAFATGSVDPAIVEQLEALGYGEGGLNEGGGETSVTP